MQKILLTGIEVSDFLEKIRAIVKEEHPAIFTAEASGKRYMNASEASAFLGIKMALLHGCSKSSQPA